MPLNLLVVASETPDQQQSRRARSGAASHETYADTLRQMAPDCTVTAISCVEGSAPPTRAALQGFAGIVFAGSPIQMHDDTSETRSAAAFMAEVFAAGTPSFGSCAGLQIAAVAAGGEIRPREAEMEAGFARGIVATQAGLDHAMLRGRPVAWDAPAMHSAQVERMPPGGTILAHSAATPVQAAQIRSGEGTFWGVQYHPEISLAEIGQALRAQVEALVEQDLAGDEAAIDRYAAALHDLNESPDRRDLAWQLGLDAEVVDADHRRREIGNFLRWIAAG